MLRTARHLVNGKEERLDGIDQLFISDIMSFHLAGKPYYRSISSIADILGLSDSAVTRRIKRLRQLEYVSSPPISKSSHQTNILELGPATIRLFTGRAQPTTSEPVSKTAHKLPSESSEQNVADEAWNTFIKANQHPKS